MNSNYWEAEALRYCQNSDHWREKCNTYMELMDAHCKELDRAMELLRRAENEMRYAGWTKYESDNSARNGVYEQIVRFLK
jgi:cysteinyl-tRNA synthetase